MNPENKSNVDINAGDKELSVQDSLNAIKEQLLKYENISKLADDPSARKDYILIKNDLKTQIDKVQLEAKGQLVDALLATVVDLAMQKIWDKQGIIDPSLSGYEFDEKGVNFVDEVILKDGLVDRIINIDSSDSITPDMVRNAINARLQENGQYFNAFNNAGTPKKINEGDYIVQSNNVDTTANLTDAEWDELTVVPESVLADKEKKLEPKLTPSSEVKEETVNEELNPLDVIAKIATIKTEHSKLMNQSVMSDQVKASFETAKRILDSVNKDLWITPEDSAEVKVYKAEAKSIDIADLQSTVDEMNAKVQKLAQVELSWEAVPVPKKTGKMKDSELSEGSSDSVESDQLAKEVLEEQEKYLKMLSESKGVIDSVNKNWVDALKVANLNKFRKEFYDIQAEFNKLPVELKEQVLVKETSELTETEAELTNAITTFNAVSERHDKYVIALKSAKSFYKRAGYPVEVMKAIQLDAGIPNTAIDGKMGPATFAAIVDFQVKNGLVGDGKVGAQTLEKMTVAKKTKETYDASILPEKEVVEQEQNDVDELFGGNETVTQKEPKKDVVTEASDVEIKAVEYMDFSEVTDAKSFIKYLNDNIDQITDYIRNALTGEKEIAQFIAKNGEKIGVTFEKLEEGKVRLSLDTSFFDGVMDSDFDVEFDNVAIKSEDDSAVRTALSTEIIDLAKRYDKAITELEKEEEIEASDVQVAEAKDEVEVPSDPYEAAYEKAMNYHFHENQSLYSQTLNSFTNVEGDEVDFELRAYKDGVLKLNVNTPFADGVSDFSKIVVADASNFKGVVTSMMAQMQGEYQAIYELENTVEEKREKPAPVADISETLKKDEKVSDEELSSVTAKIKKTVENNVKAVKETVSGIDIFGESEDLAPGSELADNELAENKAK